MTEILFYHLTESRLEQALPPLLEKSLERGWRVVVQALDDARRDALDTVLWTYSDDSFLPHGLDTEAHADRQPIVLTAGQAETVNDATVRFMVDGAPPPDISAYERVVFMFDGHDDRQLETARDQWRRLKAEGHALTYWQQGPGGRWQKKA
ncbi:DNA polymerase III subunit chi [Rhizobium sp. EC-SD404]|uniref:DNA polymerase III subunit chi n=1 Tax=Rhizobium sp. EC-SD404 TaxID=2038389 RepID=UPI0012546AE5|nr:DNA polymerase III subunit chi [Rhizobium sp. EC-SD404]VVT16082.1 DNA polymerase III subunit chi [Rhizobium sp. EC-SD404]